MYWSSLRRKKSGPNIEFNGFGATVESAIPSVANYFQRGTKRSLYCRSTIIMQRKN